MCFATVTIICDTKLPSVVPRSAFTDLTRRKRASSNYFQALVIRVLWALSGIVLPISASTVAQAAPFAYSEAISGDLPSGEALLFFGAPVFNLEAGVNTISGNLSDIALEGFDSFAFVIPQGYQLSSVKVSYSNSVNFNGTGLSLVPGIGVPFGLATDYLAIHELSPKTLFATTTPLGAGTYSIGNFYLNYASTDPKLYLDYTFTLNVEKIAAHTQVQSRPLQTIQSILSSLVPPQLITRRNAVVLAHGWNSNADAWPKEMATSIKAVIDNRQRERLIDPNGIWDVYYVDWPEAAGNGCPVFGINISCLPPWNAYVNAGPLGVSLGKFLLSKNYDHIHLIGHSAGSNLIESAATFARPRGGKQPIIHSTFLDAYHPFPELVNYGMSANWAEQYVDKRDSFSSAIGLGSLANTNMKLPSAFNFVIDALDKPPTSINPCTSIVCAHAWPYNWYRKTVDKSSDWLYGFAASVEYRGGSVPEHQTTLRRGDECALLTPSSLCTSSSLPTFADLQLVLVPSPWSSLSGVSVAQSSTGAVITSNTTQGLHLTLTTGSPVWVSLGSNVTQGFNTLQFDYSFAAPAEGLLSVFLDDQVVFKADQRDAMAGVNPSGRISVGNVSPGQHTLSFRLDHFTSAQSSVEISNIVPSNASIIRVLNLKPVANAGQMQKVRLGTLVNLNGTRSFDQDRKPLPLTYGWKQTFGPPVLLLDSTTPTPKFTPLTRGLYKFALVVNDGQSNSNISTVKVHASKNGDLVEEDNDTGTGCVICNPFSK